MNMNDTPTADQLRDLLAAKDDQAGNHIVWIDRSGTVHADTLDFETGPIGFEKAQGTNMLVRYPTLDQGNGYVGPDASADDRWIAQLFRELVQGWSERKTGKVHYIG